MRFFAVVLAALASGAVAMQITYPDDGDSWSSVGPNTVRWSAVATDPSSFRMVIVTPTQKETELAAQVNTKDASMVIQAPSGGFPVGDNWRVRFTPIEGSQSTGILAESGSFDIVAGSGSVSATGSTTVSAASGTPTTLTGITRSTTSTGTGTVANTGSATTTVDSINPTTSSSASSVYKASGALLGLVSAVYAIVL
jgi:hypothetical protein